MIGIKYWIRARDLRELWDAKRQFIWVAAGLSAGTLIVYLDAHDDQGQFVPSFFVFLETLLLIIIAVMFWIYSRRKQ